MKLKIVTGSNRQNSNSSKIANIIKERCLAKASFSEINELNFAETDIPHWNEDYWTSSEEWAPIKRDVIAPLRDDDAFVIITPEYSGMATGLIKNFFLMCSARELGHKPALIVSVSSGIGGSYPVAELRMSSYKNTRICYIPDHVIVRNADDFSDENPASERLTYGLDILAEYSKALKGVRESGVVNHKDFPYGL
ncbi:NAD(P)H-dependent oxidoreductase [Paraneptunicella aestuarii]|uniref:NADPH-dependent FMN reductase n=1 Tax=Paraneptunicella aestuarii TaxID=2831148 RepID=UPI001E3D141B|nr:NAD(P)H-dependent oxidoreductase [Paraneptunicella aestuarii]UAA40603.1 NAD(P)H-dependent oxidoreductase [Paraneptunicella aestuarii]